MKHKFKLSRKSKNIILCLFGISIVCLIWNIVQNQSVHINEITIKSENLPEDFSGCKIAHISDLHNAEFGDENEQLLAAIKSSSPDIIVITGDTIDARQPDVQIVKDFLNNAAKIAPVYYVTGNHEYRVTEEMRVECIPANENITVLHNEDVFWQKGKSKIQIIGVDDPSFIYYGGTKNLSIVLENYQDNGYFKILLSHRPELLKTYASNNMNVVFSGHAHGGQFRLPLIGGLYAPHQGCFPKYDSGLYTENNTNLVVSRGLGNSLFPVRINNPPEIIIVTLEK